MQEISIHTFLAEGDCRTGRVIQILGISIHTFLAEGDYIITFFDIVVKISIHTFLAEGDSLPLSALLHQIAFQSTPSSRKVTSPQTVVSKVLTISIHTFLAEGDMMYSPMTSCRRISIHTFLAEGDQMQQRRRCRPGNFNPHLPRGR